MNYLLAVWQRAESTYVLLVIEAQYSHDLNMHQVIKNVFRWKNTFRSLDHRWRAFSDDIVLQKMRFMVRKNTAYLKQTYLHYVA